MRIDAHHHLWTLARGDYAWLTPDLAPIYRDFCLSDLAPHLSATQMDFPSRATSTALVAPHVRPSGIFAQPSTVRYGLACALAGCASAALPETATTATKAPTRFGQPRLALSPDVIATLAPGLQFKRGRPPRQTMRRPS